MVINDLRAVGEICGRVQFDLSGVTISVTVVLLYVVLKFSAQTDYYNLSCMLE